MIYFSLLLLVIVGLALSFLTNKQSNAIGVFQDDIVALKKDLRDDRSKYYGLQADMQQSICKLEENRLKLNDSVDTINSRLAAIIQGVDNYEKNVQVLNKKVSGMWVKTEILYQGREKQLPYLSRENICVGKAYISNRDAKLMPALTSGKIISITKGDPFILIEASKDNITIMLDNGEKHMIEPNSAFKKLGHE